MPILISMWEIGKKLIYTDWYSLASKYYSDPNLKTDNSQKSSEKIPD